MLVEQSFSDFKRLGQLRGRPIGSMSRFLVVVLAKVLAHLWNLCSVSPGIQKN